MVIATPSALKSQFRANQGWVVANPICKCRCHKAGHLQVRVALGRRSTCLLKEAPLDKGPLGLPHKKATESVWKTRNMLETVARCWAHNSHSYSTEKYLFHALWDVWRIFPEISCGRFPRNTRINTCTKHLQNFTAFFVLSCQQNLTEFCYGGLYRKCFNHVHVQKRRFTEFLIFLKRVSLLNPWVRVNFVAFPWERTRKEPRSSVRFWAATGV